MKAEPGYQLRVVRVNSIDDGVDDFDAESMADFTHGVKTEGLWASHHVRKEPATAPANRPEAILTRPQIYDLE